MANDTLTNKQMDEANERAEADTQAVLAQQVSEAAAAKQKMQDRINLLSSEIDANDEENRVMQAEITALYQKIDALKQ